MNAQPAGLSELIDATWAHPASADLNPGLSGWRQCDLGMCLSHHSVWNPRRLIEYSLSGSGAFLSMLDLLKDL